MEIWLWVGFLVFIVGLLVLDLGVFHRKAHVITTTEAIVWTGFWIVLAFVFSIGIYHFYQNHLFGLGSSVGHPLTGRQATLQFLTGYIVEKSLSLDNIFVIALIFSYFQVPLAWQHRVLFWGIFGALVMRGLMIVIGAALLERFDWMHYIFGGFLILTAVKILAARHDNLEPEKNPLIKLARRLYPVTGGFERDRFFTVLNNRRAITPLFLVLILIESSDLLFAVDSIPAIFAVTSDPFLVFTSNIFALLGLRSLYFALASLMEKFRYLKMSLVFLLAYVGVKMLLVHHHPIPTIVSLSVIMGILSVGVLASLLAGQRDTAPLVSPLLDELEEIGRLTWHQAKKLAILIIGTSLLLAGLAMLILPGPGMLAILGGLTILGTHFLWARRLLRKARRQAKVFLGKTRRAVEGHLR